MPAVLSHNFPIRQGLSDTHVDVEILLCRSHSIMPNLRVVLHRQTCVFRHSKLSRFPIEIRDFENFILGTDFGKAKPACGREPICSAVSPPHVPNRESAYRAMLPWRII